MKKILIMLSIIVATLTGCKSFDPVVAEGIAKIAGTSTAMILLDIPQVSTNQQVKAAISEVTKAVEAIVPTNGQTFAEAALPVVNTVVNKLVAEGKLKAEYAPLVKEGSLIVFSGIDLALAKYPEAMKVVENVNLVVKAFTTSFNNTFNGGPVLASKKNDCEKCKKELKKINKKRIDKIK